MDAALARCPRCRREFKSARGLHWHLRRDHGAAEREAYDLVGKALEQRKQKAADTPAGASSTASDVRRERAAERPRA